MDDDYGRESPWSESATVPAGSEELFRALVANVRDYAIFALDPRGVIATWNLGAAYLKGYRASEAIGKHFSIFYPELDREAGKPERELDIAKRDGRYEEEGWRVRKDGSLMWASVVITALWNDQGELIGFSKVTRDLTERRAAEEELRSSEERLRLLVQSVRDYAIFMLDPQGEVLSWNEGARRIKGYEASEIVGRHFSTFYTPEDLARNLPERELIGARRDGRFEDEGWRMRKDGSRFWANVVITAVYRPGGELLGFGKVTRDLTDRMTGERRAIEAAHRHGLEEAKREAAELAAKELTDMNLALRARTIELDQRRTEAEAANRAKNDFLAMVSHELRTPLNAIGGYVDLMLAGIRGSLTEMQLHDLTRVRAGQRHLLTLISDLLNVAGIEAGQVSFHIEDVRVDDVVAEVNAMIEPQASAKGVDYRIRCAEDLVARTDAERLRQILINLAGNAVKFTDRGGSVEVECDSSDDMAIVQVKDNGRGIAPEDLDRIFEPFVQLDPSRTRTGEGMGLGLSISRNLARGLGGDLTVDSQPGGGSTFTLTLPLGVSQRLI